MTSPSVPTPLFPLDPGEYTDLDPGADVSSDPGVAAGIDAVLARLADRQAALSTYIERHWSELDPVRLARHLAAHGQVTARLGRLLRDRAAICGPPPDPMEQAVDAALCELENEWGVDGIAPEGPEEPDYVEAPVSVDDLIADLETKQARLAEQLPSDTLESDAHFVRLVNVYSLNAARLGCLLRMQHTLSPGMSKELERMIAATSQSMLEEQIAQMVVKSGTEPRQDPKGANQDVP